MENLTKHVYTWEAHHPEWKENVRSAAIELENKFILIDPLIPPGAAGDSIWELIEKSLHQGKEVHSMLTVFYHQRSTQAILDKYARQVIIWYPNEGRELNIAANRFSPGALLPCNIQALKTERKFEVLFWFQKDKVLFSGDVLLGGKRDPLRVCPKSWLHNTNRNELAESLEYLLKWPIDIIHVGHGKPIIRNAISILNQALQRAK